MDDFSSPGSVNSFGYAPSPTNYIKPGKRPLSSMSPVVVRDKKTGDVRRKVVQKHYCQVVLSIGAAGGSEIISSTAFVASRQLWHMADSIKAAVDLPRVHNQLMPNQTNFESDLQQVVLVADIGF